MTSITRITARVCLGAILLAPIGAWAAGANTIADTYISSTQPNNNAGNATAVNIGAGSTALIQFDLTGLPSGLTASQISKATMTFFVNTVGTPGGIDVSQVTGAWTELGVTFNNRPPSIRPSLATFPSALRGSMSRWISRHSCRTG